MRYLGFVSILVLASCGIGERLKGEAPPADPVPDSMPEPIPIADLPEAASLDPSPEAAPVPDTTGPAPTVAALGDPTRPGLWMETPLVSTERRGRITLAGTGASAEVTLIPIDAENTAGSRLSLEGFRALGAPLTELVELSVQPL